MSQRPIDPENIQVGDRVKSLDFPGYGSLPPDESCYAIGTVRGFVEQAGCWRYEIEVEEQVWHGRPDVFDAGQLICPPVNGTLTSMGRVCNGVTKIIGSSSGHGRVVPKTCGRCGAASTGGVWCPNGCGKIG